MLSEGYRQHEWSVGFELALDVGEKGKGVSPVAPVSLAVYQACQAVAREYRGMGSRAGWLGAESGMFVIMARYPNGVLAMRCQQQILRSSPSGPMPIRCRLPCCESPGNSFSESLGNRDGGFA